jgi:hypothetical protein
LWVCCCCRGPKVYKSIKVGEQQQNKKLTRERGAGFSPFWIGLDQTHMLCYATHI